MQTFDVVVINVEDHKFERKYRKVENVNDAVDLCNSISDIGDLDFVCIIPRCNNRPLLKK